VLRRLIGLCAVVGILIVATFLIVHLIPGDPARRIAGTQASPQTVAKLRAEMGLDHPWWGQLWTYVVALAHLNLGESLVTNESVRTTLAQRFPKTAELAGAALIFSSVASLVLGGTAALFTREYRHPRAEVFFTALTGAGGAIPSYLSGTFLAFIFAVWLRWLPVAGGDQWNSIVLPCLAVSVGPVAILSRIIRVETLNVFAQDYIRVARSKRLRPLQLYLRHVLPNVLTSTLSVGGVIFASLLGGTVVVENVFAWPGLGTKLVQSVLVGDYSVVQGATLLLGILVVVINASIDAALAYVDRRRLVGAS
jgi:peptide/nickel transport system permease protein